MGIETIIILSASIAIAAAASAYAILSAPKINKEQMNPASLDSFNVTQAKEGMAVPIVYGRVRIPGNIIWWGNLVTIPIESDSGGGKGGGGGDSTVTGYQYYADVWQAICMGKVSQIKTYVSDKDESVNAASITFNDGMQPDFPPNIPNASKLKGVAHIYIASWYMGDNASTMPTIHFVVERELPNTVDNANLGNGSNPAAVIYDLLILSGIAAVDIDLDSFNTAAAFYLSKGYGLNITFNSQQEVGQMVETVLNYVGGTFYVNSQGKYALKILDPLDEPVLELSELEIKEFSVNRKTWAQMPNDFSATFVDESQDFTQRVVTAKNHAAIGLASNRISQSVDLACFRDLTTASKRIFELMKLLSYPGLEIKFKGSLALSTLLPGDVIRLSYAKYGMVSADFRVQVIDTGEVNSNTVGISASQMIETLFDDEFAETGGSEWESPVETLEPLTKQAVFELPQNYYTNQDPAYLLLFAREKGIETSVLVQFSNTGSDYVSKASMTGFSQYGTLAEDYPIDTYNIDDERGILYTPFRFDPEFASISRTDLFGRNRVLICGNEMMGFQTVIAEGDNYRLKGIVRGVLNTPIEAHSEDDSIWLLEWGTKNTLLGISSGSFFLKFLPSFGGRSIDPGLATAIPVSYTAKAQIPTKPRVTATRSGSNVDFAVFPVTWDKKGAGAQAENISVSVDPIAFEGDFEVDDNSTVQYESELDFSRTLAGAEIVTVKHRVNGRFSDAAVVNVGADDGIYYS